jgi:hypothetical protein
MNFLSVKNKMKNELPIGTGSACPLSFSIIPAGHHEKNDLKMKNCRSLTHKKDLGHGLYRIGPTLSSTLYSHVFLTSKAGWIHTKMINGIN